MPISTLVAASEAAPPGSDIVVSPLAWVAFLAFTAVLIAIDLLLHRDDHEISFKEAAVSSAVWIALGVSFTFVMWVWLGGDAATQYITGYVIEKSLSVDNVFVWAVILGYFAVPKHLQHRVLFWGIFGALVLRFAFIFAGIALLNQLEWLIFVFGGFLLFTAWRVATHDEGEIHPEQNPVLKLMRRTIPVTADYEGRHFFVRRDLRRFATPLFVVLVMVELTDVVFAVDSIPAILAVSRSQFVVFSSNVFAILGLRSLYFLLAGAADRLVYLNVGLGIILAFVGVKMIASHWYHLPTLLSLAFIAVVLTVTVVASLRATADDHAGAAESQEGQAHG
ncbi:MAG: TerC family protein [Acidimicrobiales bacterium]|nr:TerC family protein [Acidimicrobiales bacterium]MCB1259397.1 TerC family protein [Acidimicrobiales bacterium]